MKSNLDNDKSSSSRSFFFKKASESVNLAPDYDLRVVPKKKEVLIKKLIDPENTSRKMLE